MSENTVVNPVTDVSQFTQKQAQEIAERVLDYRFDGPQPYRSSCMRVLSQHEDKLREEGLLLDEFPSRYEVVASMYSSLQEGDYSEIAQHLPALLREVAEREEIENGELEKVCTLMEDLFDTQARRGKRNNVESRLADIAGAESVDLAEKYGEPSWRQEDEEEAEASEESDDSDDEDISLEELQNSGIISEEQAEAAGE